MSDLSITNVIDVSIATPPAGLSDFHVNNLAIFTKEAPLNGALTATNPGVYRSPTAVATDWGATSEVYAMANAIFGQSPNILDGGGELIISPMQSGDTLTTAIPALVPVVPFYGVIYAGYAPNDAEIIAAAPVVEPLRIKLFASASDVAALTPTTGLFAILAESTLPHTRAHLYSVGPAQARLYTAAYAGRAMCVNFEGANTTNSMHLKQLVGIPADTGLSQANIDACQTLGVDVYVTIAGRPSCFTSGANQFFDNVYNEDWLVFALEVAGFNALAETSTKLPQTEPGMAVLRGAYITVLQKAVKAGYLAPGQWNSSELFGDPNSLRQAIRQLGWYIYSLPVNQQAEAARQARKAPLIQIAIKLAGAIHSSAVVVNINE